MIIILHGDDTVSSKGYVYRIKDIDSLTVSAEETDPSEFFQTLLGDNLFSKKQKIIVENLFSKKATTNLDLLKKNLSKIESDLVFWEPKELSKTSLNLFPKAEVKLFKLPQFLFNFLDGVKPHNPQNVTKFHQALKDSEAELLFFMLVRQVRLMLGVFDDTNKIDEVKRIAPWQRSKIMNQAKSFGPDKLKNIYKKLYKIETDLKLGRLSSSLTNTIDFLLIEI